ncbi:ABC transporter permease subunit [Paenibacillus sp. GCM10012306]|uniref:ABC transporter permease subunit n=1 Tax=Paenibacillus sp. GCM10012306 TaxID=3317342 RepID=UPI00361529B9
MGIIMGMTWKEMIRKRVMVLTMLMTVVFLLAFWFVAASLGKHGISPERWVVGNTELLIAKFTNGTIILTLGFFFGSFVLAFLAIFSSFSAIAGEAEQGVLQALLPRPLPRWKWYLGRWMGFVTLGLGYALLLYVAIMLITKFHAAIPMEPVAWILSFLLFASAVPILVTVSMLGSGWFSALGNGVFMTMLYGAGWLGGMIEKLAFSVGLEPEIMDRLKNMTGIISLLMPVDGMQRKMLSELFNLKELGSVVSLQTAAFGINNFANVPSGTFVMYAAGYTIVALIVGLWIFQRKDL